ncbi:MAG: hypothetical protein M3348_01380 [Acidobacteriota bacterium]|nr:hypothetical protein [Acidobacteriota bacterium]
MVTESRTILESLRAGSPINGDEGQQILSERLNEAIRAATRAVERARGLLPSRIREAYWITGKPGNGKTQSLNQLAYSLPNLKGAGKYAYAILNFDKEPEARRPEGIVPSVVRHTLAANVIKQVQEVRDVILKGSAADETVKTSVGFGIDVVTGLAGMPSPALFATAGIKKAFSALRGREWYVKRQLRKKWSSNPQLLELLNSWIRYILSPTPDRENEFSTTLRRLTTTGILFDLFCFALEKAGYSALVLAFDEVNEATLSSIKPLWDRPDRNGDRPYHELNMILVISSTDSVRAYAEADEALRRRFCATDDGLYLLNGPHFNTSGEDDFDHVVKKVRELRAAAPNLLKREDKQEMSDLRAELSARNDVTWQVLWSRVISLMTDL